MPRVEQELLILPEHPCSPPFFSRVQVARSLAFYLMFCRLLFFHLSFSFWSLYCLCFFHLPLLITPFVIFKPFLIWDRHNLFEGRSPIILGGRREKGMYFFFKYFLIIFFKLFGWSYLSLTYGCSVHFTYLRRSSADNLVERDFLIRILFQVYFDFA